MGVPDQHRPLLCRGPIRAGTMLFEEIRRAVEAAPRDRLSELSAALWKGFAAGAVTEAEAEEITLLIEARKGISNSRNKTGPPGGLQRGRGAAIPARKLQRPPVRSVAIERRRRLAASGVMPPAL